MKKFKLDLSEWKVPVTEPVTKMIDGKEVRVFEEKEIVYPFKDNLNQWLRSPGVFRSGEEIAEAVVLAKHLRDCPDDSVVLDEREVEILKKALNRHIEASADGEAQIPLGGPIHEEAICRVFTMTEEK